MTKYLPDQLRTIDGGMQPVVNVQAFPPGYKHGGPIKPEYTAVRAALANGDVRWFGCADAWIDSSLRMVLSGLNPRDEVRARWEDAPPAFA